MAKKPRIPHKFHPWINARKQFRLSDAHIQMARELGLSPKRFAKYADRENQPWKLPLTEFIEAQYLKQFGKDRPDEVKTMEEIAAAHVAKRAARKLANANRTSDSESDPAEAANNAATKTDCMTETTDSTTTTEATPAATDETAITQPTPETAEADVDAPPQPNSGTNLE